MSESAVVETQETSRPNSLLALENKSSDQLPQEIAIKDKGLMTSFRLLGNRTKTDRKEWSGYVLKDRAETLTLDFIAQGEEARSQQVFVEDLTGLFDQPGKLYEGDLHLLDLKLKNEDFRIGKLRPKVILGRDLPEVSAEKLHLGVIVRPRTEFFGLSHTHPDGEAHSIGDLALSINQARRPDGRVSIPVSVVIGNDNLYVLVVPTDGVIDEVQNSLFEGMSQLEGQMELEKEFASFMKEHGFSDEYKALDPFLERVAQQRKFGFYKGNLKDGILKKVV